MSAMDLAVWPEAAMVIFLGVFALVCGRVLSGRHAAEYKRAGDLPLAADAPEVRR